MSTLIDRHELKETLRRKKATPAAHKHPVNQAAFDDRDFGERIADQLDRIRAILQQQKGSLTSLLGLPRLAR